MWGQSASTLNYYAQCKMGHQIKASLEDGSFLSFINTTFRSVFKESLPISRSLKSPECRACSDIATRGHCYLVLIVFQLFHGNIEWGRCVQLKAQRLQRREVGKTWTNPFFFFFFAVCSGRPDTWANTAARWSVISYGNQHQPGRFCQRTKENASN